MDSLRHFLGEVVVAPIVEEPVVQPELIDGGQLVPKPLVQILDGFRIPFHGASSGM
jgi:hypothetical protein